MQGQLFGETANTLHFEAVVNHQDEDADGQTKGTVGVGGRNDLPVIQSQRVANTGHQVDRQPFQAVHQEDPDEDGQCQRPDQRVTAMEGIAHDALDKLDQNLNQVLQS